ncbi:unnamed protein product [Adineta ricciae]|uniref:G-protein coupled receptors family 1 profile domain-containing protein n=2 Tax=Adineta ricciae TaxID=249248 RepID=A0A815DE02_ADIRI|nr:unnamed protein product [Adineta ricciae]
MSNTTTNTALNDETQSIIFFNFLTKILAQCLDGFSWIVGNIGAICICIVFSQPTFRKSPCAIYFIASSLSQLFVFNFAVFIRIIQYGYAVPVNSAPSWFCKMRFYIFYVSAATARYNIIFASADRYLCSCRDARRRHWSSTKTAFRLIVLVLVVWLLFYIQILVFFDVKNNKCTIRNTSVITYLSYFITVENGFFPIFPMLIFGLLTIRNIHGSRRTVAARDNSTAQSVQTERSPRKEKHLHKMLFSQVILFVISNIPYPVYTIYRSYAGVSSFTGSRALMDTFINNLLYDMVYLGFALTFPNFLLTSKMFRREFLQVLQTKIVQRCQRLMAA